MPYQAVVMSPCDDSLTVTPLSPSGTSGLREHSQRSNPSQSHWLYVAVTVTYFKAKVYYFKSFYLTLYSSLFIYSIYTDRCYVDNKRSLSIIENKGLITIKLFQTVCSPCEIIIILCLVYILLRKFPSASPYEFF